MRLTLKETREREVLIKDWLDQGLGVTEMASNLKIRPEAVRKFLKLRGWETEDMKVWRLSREGHVDADSE